MMKSNPSKTHRTPTCPWGFVSRRDFLKGLSAAAMAPASLFQVDESQTPSTLPRTVTSVEICKRYDYPLVRKTLAKMLDEIGGIEKTVKNKYVTIKVNLVNVAKEHVNGIPLELTVVTHPVVAVALGNLLVKYGAKQVTYCEQLPYQESGEAAFARYGYDPSIFASALDGKARFENTRNLGSYKSYALVKTPNSQLAHAWEVNQAYSKTDVLISLGKLKSHVSAGVSLGMKNLFGVPPSSLYGDDLTNEPDENATGYRSTAMHNCTRKPFTSISTFSDQTQKDEHGYNVPRFIVDLCSTFPIHLTVIDGISTIQSAEGWWMGSLVSATAPGLLIAGTNPVCTDAVATSVMGFNPDAKSLTLPFANGTNYLKLARTIGMGENRIENLDIIGVGLDQARYHFLPTYLRAQRS
jgi:uncharacterized protein (DUF362 family)